MNWKNTDLNHITTTNLFYFDENQRKACRTICEALHIDCFPAIDENKYWKIEGGEWIAKSINYSTDGFDDAFDQRILDLFSENGSNIIFRTNNSLIKGVIHFVNYENAHVFATIYHNLNVFEKELRRYLAFCGLDDAYFLRYLEEHKLRNASESQRERTQNRIDALKTYLGANQKKQPFEKHYLSELMEFAISSYHKRNTAKLNSKPDLAFLNEKITINELSKTRHELINQLRNSIMHHHAISGETLEIPHDFDDFKTFYQLLLNFKETFLLFANRTAKMNRVSTNALNSKRLQFVSTMNQTEIEDYFYGMN